MCQYHYIYASACQHADFYRVSYCDKAKALSSDIHDNHSPRGSGPAEANPGSRSPSKQAPSSRTDNSNTHSQSQQQDITSMSTLTHSETIPGLPFETTLAVTNRHIVSEKDLIPRSTLTGASSTESDGSPSSDATLLPEGDAVSLSNEAPVSIQSSISVLFAHGNGVAASTPASGPHTHHESSEVVIQLSEPDYDDTSDEDEYQTLTRQQRPQKRIPIPVEWLTSNTSPGLATAQRTKEREQMRNSPSRSPVETRTIRGPRSSNALRRQGGNDAPAFLTKEALACVESNITSPATSPRSPTRVQRPAWQSPTVSPRRESPRQTTTTHAKLSPTRQTFLSIEPASSSYRRGPSSVATSSGDTVFHDVEGSPVRSTTDSEQSFASAEEALDDDVEILQEQKLDADQCSQQGAVHSRSLKSKSSTIGRANTLRPKLSVRIPPAELQSEAKSPVSRAKHSAISATSNSPSSPHSASTMSRISRAAAGTMRSAHAPTLSSTLKKTQSLRSLTSNSKGPHSCSKIVDQPLTVDNSTPPTHHVRTLDSSDSTPILTGKSTPVETSYVHPSWLTDSPASTGQETIPYHDTWPTESTTRTHEGIGPSGVDNVDHIANFATRDDVATSEPTSRASSACTVKASSCCADPAAADSSVLYSRKKSEVLGMEPPPFFQQPPIIVMMAHKIDIGNLQLQDRTDAEATTTNVVPRSNQSETSESLHHSDFGSAQSSHASDLRATAPEFVPQITQTNPVVNTTAASDAGEAESHRDLLGTRAHELDMYGIPWFYYMYQVQTAYAQGFQNGRAKSPKKNRRSNNRSSLQAQQHANGAAEAAPPKLDAANDTSASPAVTEEKKDMPPPASTIPLAVQRAQAQRENSRPPSRALIPSGTTAADDSNLDPFAGQLTTIDRHVALQNVTNRSRNQNVDLTAIQNANMPTATYNNAPFHADMWHTVHRGGQRSHGDRRRNARSYNGLYNYHGRGTVGVPIDAVTFPDPIAPQGRPQGIFEHAGNNIDMGRYLGYSVPIGKEACGVVDIVIAAERGGGAPCNACEPDHPLV